MWLIKYKQIRRVNEDAYSNILTWHIADITMMARNLPGNVYRLTKQRHFKSGDLIGQFWHATIKIRVFQTRIFITVVWLYHPIALLFTMVQHFNIDGLLRFYSPSMLTYRTVVRIPVLPIQGQTEFTYSCQNL